MQGDELNVSYMYGEPVEVRPTCDCCQREVERVRSSMWHGDNRICLECFSQWYDPDNGSIDVTDPVSIGNYVRKKHGLGSLDAATKTT